MPEVPALAARVGLAVPPSASCAPSNPGELGARTAKKPCIVFRRATAPATECRRWLHHPWLSCRQTLTAAVWLVRRRQTLTGVTLGAKRAWDSTCTFAAPLPCAFLADAADALSAFSCACTSRYRSTSLRCSCSKPMSWSYFRCDISSLRKGSPAAHQHAWTLPPGPPCVVQTPRMTSERSARDAP
jgi:hypothetical protein